MTSSPPTRLENKISPAPCPENKHEHWFYTGRLSAFGNLNKTPVMSVNRNGDIRAHHWARVEKPTPINYFGKATAPLRALWLHYIAQDDPAALDGFRLVSCPMKRAHSPEHPFTVVRCCNPWHARRADAPFRAQFIPDAEPSFAATPTDHPQDDLATLIGEWTSDNNQAPVEVFHALYTDTGDWPPADLRNAILRAIERDLLTPRWVSLLS